MPIRRGRLCAPLAETATKRGAAQVFANDDGTTRFVWIADLLPDEAAEITAGLMERGIDTVKQTLEAAAG